MPCNCHTHTQVYSQLMAQLVVNAPIFFSLYQGAIICIGQPVQHAVHVFNVCTSLRMATIFSQNK
jgi:hypothetical protein